MKEETSKFDGKGDGERVRTVKVSEEDSAMVRGMAVVHMLTPSTKPNQQAKAPEAIFTVCQFSLCIFNFPGKGDGQTLLYLSPNSRVFLSLLSHVEAYFATTLSPDVIY